VNPFSILDGGLGLTNPNSSDAGLYGPVSSMGTTGTFNFGFGAGTAQGQGIPLETLLIVGMLAWFVISKR
jgi:hypothetical protein